MKATIEKVKLRCYHCGDNCLDQAIQSGDKWFCCTGCKTVYEILNENSLCDYYSLEHAPGNKIESKQEGEYAFLKEERIQQELLNFRDGSICGITLYIPSVHCSSCIWLLENLHKIHEGVIRSSISFQKKELEVQYNSELISLDQLALLLDRLGYPPQITLQGKPVNNKSINRSLFYKIGIAGFCFGNIMLLSIPEYVSFLDDFNGEFKSFFSFLNLLLALPVFFYSASDYFISAWNALKNRMINIDLPIALGLIAAFGQSLVEIGLGKGMGYLDSLTGLIFFLLIGKWYQRKTYEAISFQRDYKSYFPLASTVVKEGKEIFIPLNELHPGDLIRIKNQDLIPADGIVRTGKARIDYSFVTGESVPVTKKTGEQVFAGGRQTGESIQIEIIKRVSESYLTQLWNRDRSDNNTAYGLVNFTNKVGKYFTIAVLVIALGTYGFWYFQDPSKALHAAVSVLIIFCPCTLALAIPFCFGNAMNRLGKNGLFLKNTETVEKLAENDAIVFDKTGTITEAGSAEIEEDGFLTNEEKGYVKSLVRNSNHPLSRLLYNHLLGANDYLVEDFQEKISYGISGIVNGRSVKVGSYKFMGIERNMEGKETHVFVSINDHVKVCYTLKNKYRSGVFAMIQKLHKIYPLFLLSGDNDGEREVLKNHFSLNAVHFNQSPSDKLNFIESLSGKYKTLMIGDGLNDAGALMESNCGISVSESNGNFSPACDAILDSRQLIRLSDFLAYCKACVTTVRLSLIISLSYNIIGLYFACQGTLKPLIAAILMPLSSVSIVLFVTILSNVLARKYRLK